MLSLSEAQSWPDGTYCLPKPRNSPCPSGWKTGHRHHDTEDRDGSMYCNVKRHGWVPYNTAWCRNLGWGFCCKTRANYPPTGKTWPRGAYCIFKKGVSCPRGFSSGKKPIFANFLIHTTIKWAVSRFYCASKMCANLKNCLPTINQVRSEIRYTIYNPSLCRTSLFFLKIEGCCIFSNRVALILNVSLRRLF